MLRSPLPPELGEAFTVQRAAAAGVSASRLRAGDLDAPFHGIRALAPTTPASEIPDVFRAATERCVELAHHYGLGMEADRFFSHITAAILWQVPLPAWVLLPGGDGRPRSETLDVAVFAPLRTPRAAGIRGHQVRRTHASVRRHRGVLLTSPATTLAMLAGVLRDPWDLVAAGDAIVRERIFARDRAPLATLDELRAAVSAGRRPGVGRLRAALPLIRTRSASRRETLLRLHLVEAGLAEPALNLDVVDRDGRFLACVDLAYPRARIAVEYEGDHHRSDPKQWARDLERYERLDAAGWIVVRVSADQLDNRPAEVVARVRRALARRV